MEVIHITLHYIIVVQWFNYIFENNEVIVLIHIKSWMICVYGRCFQFNYIHNYTILKHTFFKVMNNNFLITADIEKLITVVSQH
jgi:hypothetical protein